MEFEFNLKKAKRSLATLICASLLLLLLILITNNVVISFLSESLLLIIFSIVLVLGYFSVLFYRLIVTSRQNISIKISDHDIQYPDYFLSKQKISISKIYSIENLIFRGEIQGIILGIAGKSRQLIDAGIFKCNSDFIRFLNILKNKINSRDGSESFEIMSRLAHSQLNKKPYSSGFIIILYLLIFLIGNNGDIFSRTPDEFLYLGGNTKELFQDAQLYRIFSSFFIHTRFLHIGLNIFVFSIFAYLLEKTVSQIRFINITLISSLVAVICSNIFIAGDGSVGASGGIFGLFGAYVLFKYRYEKYLPGSINSIPLYKLVLLLVLEFYLEIYWLENVDYINHISGFIAGLGCMFVIKLGPKLETVDQPTLFEKGLCATLVSAYALGLSYFLLLYYGVI